MKGVAIAVCCGVMVVRGVAVARDPSLYETAAIYMRPWFRFDAVAAGCILALARMPRKENRFFWLAAPALLVWSVYESRIPQEIFLSVETVLAAWLLWTVITGGPEIRQMFSARWLRWLGLVSYSVYLWQQLFLLTDWRGTPLAWMGRFPVNVALAIGVGWISRRFVEMPFLKPHAVAAIESSALTEKSPVGAMTGR